MPWLEGEAAAGRVSVASLRRKGDYVADQEMPPEASASSTCPLCGTEMAVIRIAPILFGGEFEDLTLACKTCGATKEFRIRRS